MSQRLRLVAGWFGLVLVLSGCGGREPLPTAVAPSYTGVMLRVAALGDDTDATQALKPIDTQRGEWSATRGGEIQLEPEPLRDVAASPEADVLVFPAARLGDLLDAEALALIPFDAVRPPKPAAGEESRSSEDERAPEDFYRFSDILPELRDQILKQGSDLVALPMGSSTLVVVYRRDVFERPANQEAARAAGLELKPPETYVQLDALARFFQGRDWDGSGQPKAGIALALGPDGGEGVGTDLFLARAAALGQHPDYYGYLFDDDDMAPRIGGPPFLEALAGLTALAEAGPPGMKGFDPAAARTAFREGRVPLLIDRAERGADWSDPRQPVAAAVAPLPGSERVYDPARKEWEEAKPANRPGYLARGGGWLLGVTAKRPHFEAALDLVKFLSAPETSSRMLGNAEFPMLPVRSSQLGADPVDPRRNIRGLGLAVSRSLAARRVVSGLRIPGASAYQEALEQARTEALAGGDPTAALQKAATAWDAQTDRLDRARQRWHYRRSLGLRVDPTPPARAATAQ